MNTIQLPTNRGVDVHGPVPVCPCGQDLDACSSLHCPRCGCARPTECHAPRLPLRVA